jgi:hypothetical protein
VRKLIVVFFAIGVTLALTSCKPKNKITQDELVRRTQELFDSVAPGNQAPWKKYFADDCMYFDEKGRNMKKLLWSRMSLLCRPDFQAASK